MSDVLLVNPKSIDILPSYLPYGLLYLASFLRTKKVSVVIFDSNTMTEDFLDFIKACRPKLVGLSILSGPCLADAVDKARLVRKHFPKTRIVFGGIHTTIFPREVLQNDYVDFIIQGEGEEPLLELTEFILKGKGFLAKIKNLGYKEGKRLKLNPLRPFIDLNQLPLPAWDLVPIEKYLHQKFYASRVLTLHTSRGCPWDCAYCYNRLVNFRRWRAISAEKIIAQIEYLISHYQVNGIQFYDDEFDVDEERVKRFCRLLLEKKIKIKWSHYSRTNIADESRYCLEKEAGCAFIEFGVESGSPRLLKMLRKDQTIRQIKRAFLICRKIGLSAGAMFMIGLPTETERELLMTQKLINFLSAYQTICTIYHPYPGSELYKYCLDNKLMVPPPKELEKQGPYFDLSNTQTNVSQVKKEKLGLVYQTYFFDNVWEEVKLSLRDCNFGLVWSHAKSRFNLENVVSVFSGMKNYFLSRILRYEE